MARFWVYLDNQVQGPVEVPALRKLPGFNLLTQVCAEGQESWRMADEIIEIKAYFSAPPRGSSLIAEAAAAPAPIELPQTQMPSVTAVAETLPSPAGQKPDPDVETLPEPPAVAAPAAATQPAGGSGLRVLCATCGYKNPRDITVCMKCGSPVKPGATSVQTSASPGQVGAPAAQAGKPLEERPIIPAMTAASPLGTPVYESPMVDIPVKRIAIILGGILLAGALLFGIRAVWKAKKRPEKTAVVTTVSQPPPPARAVKKPAPGKPKAVSQTTPHQRAVRAKLPGVSAAESAAASSRSTSSSGPSSSIDERESRREGSPRAAPSRPKSGEEPTKKVEAKSDSDTASYSVLSEAYPLQHRTAAPVDSPYAQKRRGDRVLWAGREGEAIQWVQNHRIYGGQRTIRRNSEILMQILRDREYISAFENGKRLYLFNDVDWGAVTEGGPIYEVRLTFSGGRDADGSPRAPLRFAFKVDLERQTVEPGSSGMIKANTLHGFFDESRIPPEERRSVAKDTEQLVRAAQPGESPLALETISKNYAATYSFSALARVAETYGLTILNKKLAHATPSVKEAFPSGSAAANGSAPVSKPASAKPAVPSASGAIEYTMERGSGRDRRVTAQAPSRATPAKLWETLTSYDRLTQFVPDLLVSQRAGQDGRAVVVHTVSLTRLMFFVFKVNLHLRILEYPQQHRLEFERIAGDFEKFSGYAEMAADPTGTRSTLALNVTMAPKGYVPDWAFRGMAKHFMVPVLEAIRSKAESY